MSALSTPSDPFTLWSALSDHEITLAHVDELLNVIDDDLWVSAECADRLVDDTSVQRRLLEVGILRSNSAIDRAKATLSRIQDEHAQLDHADSAQATLSAYFASELTDAQLCQVRSLLLHRLDLLQTFEEAYEHKAECSGTSSNAPNVDPGWEDDPWAVDDRTVQDDSGEGSLNTPPFKLPIFLQEDLSVLCFALAANMQFKALKTIWRRHHSELVPYRLDILEQIPAYAKLSDYRDLLPTSDTESDSEPWRNVPDWVEVPFVKEALQSSGVNVLQNRPNLNMYNDTEPAHLGLTLWYRRRVETIMESTGMVDMAIDFVQHAISLGIQGLDEIGEDLTLISRLIYDSPRGHKDTPLASLSQWRLQKPEAIVQEYLRYSNPDTIVSDVRRLVLPYLFVLEARADRAGKPLTNSFEKCFYPFVLSTSLEIVVEILEASKPTVVVSQRIITDDEDLARLALASLYGNDSTTEWSTMTRIFECLPAWKFQSDSTEGVDTVITSLSAFLKPSTASPQNTRLELFELFRPLDSRKLSRMLDILDVHLESGETLARWNIGIPLHSFLQGATDKKLQRSWATKMARQAAEILNDPLSEYEWTSVLDDMVKLSRREGETPAFGLLDENEIREIVISALLRTGKFDTVKNFLIDHQNFLSAETVERICLSCSREFYDNANSGNIHTGNMKLAYDCLSVSQPTPQIVKEREFIEATSRISSFNVMSKPGVPLLPIEIRLTKDRLGLVSRVMSSNDDAYKHAEVMLDLTRKLGYQDDPVAEVKTLAMIADTALQAEDFPRAFEASGKMIDKVQQLQAMSDSSPTDGGANEAANVCWVSCFQLGRYPEEDNKQTRLDLLGRGLQLCPPDKITDVLTAWRKLEGEVITEHHVDHESHRPQRPKTIPQSLAARLQRMQLPSPGQDATMLASQALSRVTANFPFTIGRQEHDHLQSNQGPQRTGSPDVQSQARHALQRGIGWLIGADEDL